MSVYSECGHEYHGNHCAKCAREAGAAEERAKIVAWLRKTAKMNPQTPEASAFVLLLCKAIEAKEHLK